MIRAVLAASLVLGGCHSDQSDYSASTWYFFEPQVVEEFIWPNQLGERQELKTWAAFRMRAPAGLEVRRGPTSYNTPDHPESSRMFLRSPPGLPGTTLFWHFKFARTSPEESGIDDNVIDAACGVAGDGGQPTLVHYQRNGRDVVVCRPPGFAGASFDELADTLVISQAYVGHTVTRCEIRAAHPTKQQIDDLVDTCSSVTASSCTKMSNWKYSDTTCE